MMTGLFISGINASWAISIPQIDSESKRIRPVNQYFSQANREISYELNHPADLALPSSSKEVLVRTYQTIKLDELEIILLKNNPQIKIYLEKIDQAKSLLRNSLSFWYPTLNLTANGIPKYFESNNYY